MELLFCCDVFDELFSGLCVCPLLEPFRPTLLVLFGLLVGDDLRKFKKKKFKL